MELTIGFSPCPNDTFIFDALVNAKIPTGNIRFKPVLEDVQTLNEWALEGKLDITKLSYHTFFEVEKEYRLLEAGSALGKGVGPLLISREPLDPLADLSEMEVVLPGWNTTAHMLLRFAYPQLTRKKVLVFSEIEQAVSTGKYPLGVIIHEGRFSYREKGLHLVKDLGEHWEEKTNAPIPLGGIVMRKSLGEELATEVNEMIRRSLAVSWANYPNLSAYVTTHAQEMKESIMRQHIELYVNEFTRDLGDEGHTAIRQMGKVLHSLADA